MDVDALVVHEGDRATATGRLVRNDRGDWFEPVLMIAEQGGLERRIRRVWKGAVRVAGADLDAVAGRFEKDRAVEGWATVTGTWSGEQLRVERQDAPVAVPALARWVTPPCPLLECGWPAVERRGDVELSYDLGDLAGTGAAVAITLFHPARTRRYWSSLPLTLPLWRLGCDRRSASRCAACPAAGPRTSSTAPTPPAPALAALELLPARTTALRRRPGSHRRPPRPGVLPEIAVWAASLLPGIVTLEPWLIPADGDRGATC